MPESEYLLAGLTLPAFESPGKPREKSELAEVRFAAELGKIAEDLVLNYWANPGCLDRNLLADLSDSYHSLLDTQLENPSPAGTGKQSIGDILAKPCDYPQIYEVLKAVGLGKEGFNDELVPTITWNNNQFAQLVNLVNSVSGDNIYKILNKHGGIVETAGHQSWYFFNFVMALARQLVYPTLSLGQANEEVLLADSNRPLRLAGAPMLDVPLIIGGKLRGQMDGVMVSSEHLNRDSFDLRRYIENGLPYGLIELKTEFRLRFCTGKRKLMSPRGEQLRQYLHKLGNLLVSWDNNSQEPFNFPAYLVLVRLRGPMSPAIHLMWSNSKLLEDWRNALEMYPPDSNHDVDRLLGILDREICYLKSQETKNFSRLDVDKKQSGEQLKLI